MQVLYHQSVLLVNHIPNFPHQYPKVSHMQSLPVLYRPAAMREDISDGYERLEVNIGGGYPQGGLMARRNNAQIVALRRARLAAMQQYMRRSPRHPIRRRRRSVYV